MRYRVRYFAESYELSLSSVLTPSLGISFRRHTRPRSIVDNNRNQLVVHAVIFIRVDLGVRAAQVGWQSAPCSIDREIRAQTSLACNTLRRSILSRERDDVKGRGIAIAASVPEVRAQRETLWNSPWACQNSPFPFLMNTRTEKKYSESCALSRGLATRRTFRFNHARSL